MTSVQVVGLWEVSAIGKREKEISIQYFINTMQFQTTYCERMSKLTEEVCERRPKMTPNLILNSPLILMYIQGKLKGELSNKSEVT